jgi:hypothetical protein
MLVSITLLCIGGGGVWREGAEEGSKGGREAHGKGARRACEWAGGQARDKRVDPQPIGNGLPVRLEIGGKSAGPTGPNNLPDFKRPPARSVIARRSIDYECPVVSFQDAVAGRGAAGSNSVV